MATSYSGLYHSWQLALKPLDSDGDFVNYPVTNGKMARGTDFEPSIEFKSEDYEGQCGIKDLVLQSDRVSVTAEPEYKHGVVFNECLEEYCYMVTGSHESVKDAITGTTPTTNSEVFKWVFYQDLNSPKPLPKATLINQYNATLRDAVVFDDAMLNEFGITMNDKGVSCSVKFMSNAPIMNQPNQTMNTVDLVKLGKENISIYIAPLKVDGTAIDLSTMSESAREVYSYDCILSNELTFKTNLEESACLNREFGKNVLDEGKFEIEGKSEIKWNPKSAFLYDEYYSGEKQYHGAYATDQSLFKQILIVAKGKTLKSATSGSTTTDYKAELNIYLPKVEISKCGTQYAGEDNKTLEIEYANRQNGSVSPVKFTIITPMKELTYGQEFTPNTTYVGNSGITGGIDLN